MLLSVGNVNTRVERYAPDECAWLRDYLCFPDSRQPRYRSPDSDGKVRLLNEFVMSFPTGFLPSVAKAARAEGMKVEVVDRRVRPAVLDPGADLAWLRDYQRAAFDALAAHGRGIVSVPTGGGKCLAPETMVLLADGSTVRADEVRVGDRLLGPDSTPRTVLSVCSGVGPMFRIVPLKGDSFVCNDVHVLTLVETVSGRVIDVPLDEYLKKSRTFKHCHKLFFPRAGVEFPVAANPPQVSAYFLGVWYGDGRKDLSQGVQVSKPDREIEDACREEAERWGLELRVDRYKSCPTYRLVGAKGNKCNPLLNALRAEVGDGQRIPLSIRQGSLATRLAFAAGILDTDGDSEVKGIDVVQKQRGVADDLRLLLRSVGLQATMRRKVVDGKDYWRLTVSGDLDKLPMRVRRKIRPPRRQVKDPTRVGFSVVPLGVGPYAGFTLDGDGRFLLADFTVTHNTELFVALARAFACQWLFVAPAADLVVQAAERWDKRNRDDGVDLGPAGVIGSGRWSVGPRFTAATFQTLHAGLKRGDARVLALLKETQGLGVDESHTLPADSYLQVANACQAYYRFGFSGTPLSRGDRRSVLSMATLGPVVYKIPAKPLIEAGVLSLPRVRLATVTQELSAPFDEAYERLVVHSKKRNGRVVKMALGAARPCFVFVEREEHGRVLQKAFAAAGERVDFVHGDIKKVDERKRIARACIARSGILVCTRVFQTGLDFPELASGVNAAGYASVIAVLQRLGRGMRVDKASGKDTFEMYDVLDLGNEYLERHARARKNTYAAQGYETVVEPEAL